MKFGQNQSFSSRGRVQTSFFWLKLEIFTVFIVWWPWKFDHGHKKSNQIFKPSQSYNIWFGQNPSFGSRDRVLTSFFGQNLKYFYSFYSVVTLKIWSWSPKSNQIFKPSQSYNNIWSLARIRHLVQEIGCRQAFLVKIWKFQSADVTLKMRSQKSNHFFPPSK